MYNLIFGPALFYDIPEYLSIVSTHSFWQVFSLGHFPIHPFFLAILWLLIKFIPVNAIPMLFGVLSIFLVYRISKLFFRKGWLFLTAVVFALFPAIWLINTNLMVESVSLTLYLFSVYFFLSKKPVRYLLATFVMVGVHLESIFWIPATFLLPFIFSKELKYSKKELTHFVKLTVISVLASILFYLLIYLFSGRQLIGSTEQLSTYLSSGILRMIRNAVFTYIAGFGSLTVPVLLILVINKVRIRKEIVAWIIFFAGVSLIAANWQGDFMPRRVVFAGLIISLAIYKYLGKISVLVALYLVPIVIANVILYAGGSHFVQPRIPNGQILIQTHYLAPFTNYDGTILWVEGDDLAKIDSYLLSGKRVFMSADSVTAPYRLLVGNNYHITSLGRVGTSDTRFLFEKYKISKFDGVLELKLNNGKVSPLAGEPVISYDESFWSRLARRRVDYGDLGTWLWALAVNHRDPIGWTYIDVTGNSVKF